MGWRNTQGYTNRAVCQLLPRRLARITTTVFIYAAAGFQRGGKNTDFSPPLEMCEDVMRKLCTGSQLENRRMTFHILPSCENKKEKHKRGRPLVPSVRVHLCLFTQSELLRCAARLVTINSSHMTFYQSNNSNKNSNN